MAKRRIKVDTVTVVMCEVAGVAFPVITCASAADADRLAAKLTRDRVMPTLSREQATLGEAIKAAIGVAKKDVRYWAEETMFITDSSVADAFADSFSKSMRAISVSGPLGQGEG